MAARLGDGGDEAITDINITPFVDIILVVLIIFMVTATWIVKQSIKVQLPEAATGESLDQESLAVVIDPSGKLYLDGRSVSKDELRAAVRQKRREGADVVCLIGADSETRHKDLVAVIDLVRQEGVAKFAFNIDPVKPPAEAAGAVPANRVQVETIP